MDVFIEHPLDYKKSVRLEEIFLNDSEKLYKACSTFCNFLNQPQKFKSCCPTYAEFLSRNHSASEIEYNIFRKKWYDEHTLEMTREAREKVKYQNQKTAILNDVKTIGKKHQVNIEWSVEEEHWRVIRANGEDLGFFYL